VSFQILQRPGVAQLDIGIDDILHGFRHNAHSLHPQISADCWPRGSTKLTILILATFNNRPNAIRCYGKIAAVMLINARVLRSWCGLI
jgi:hypothetical protein